jgi:catechol 2,3-dioxygenase-like lactoylglutathione lyase family enzyme
MPVVEGLLPVKPRTSVIKPYVLSHGTCECRNLKETRRFYEEFLGLEVVRHAPPGMVFRCGLKFHVVCVEVGDTVHPCSLLNHWGLDVETRDEVDRAREQALALKDTYGIKQVLPIEFQHGVYSFYLEDLNHNWWEVQHYDGYLHDDFFDFGDRFGESVLAPGSAA